MPVKPVNKENLIQLLVDTAKLYGKDSYMRDLLSTAAERIAELEERVAIMSEKGFGWISVKDRLPEQAPSLFSRFKGTDKWKKAMWVMDSKTVLVNVVTKGESIVTTGKLQDGKWCTRISQLIDYTVTHWMPFPEPPKEDEQNDRARTD